MDAKAAAIVTAILYLLGSPGCNEDGDTPKDGGQGTAGNAQTPPMGATAITAWLTQGHYRSWHCEMASHAARSPSPHETNRICSNDLLSSHGTGEFPVGAASVKELFTASGTSPAGYAVALHVKAGTQGDSWYWYETLPGSGVVADGLGDSGGAKSICVGCHVAAGSDAAHAGHDFVYTQVK